MEDFILFNPFNMNDVFKIAIVIFYNVCITHL